MWRGPLRMFICSFIQGDSGGNINILVGDSVGPCEKSVYLKVCVILNGYRERERERAGGRESCLYLQIQKHYEW